MPESYGLYFSWGNTDGHPAGAGYDFSQDVYDTTPAAGITEDLSLSQDAARTYLGAPWRMPTIADFLELNANCTSVWTTLNGVYGRLFTSNLNGRTIFLPAAGYYNGTTLSYRRSIGRYWSSSHQLTVNAYDLYFDGSNIYPQNHDKRHLGFSVRPVQDGTPNRSIVRPTSVSEPTEEETPTTEETRDDNQR